LSQFQSEGNGTVSASYTVIRGPYAKNANSLLRRVAFTFIVPPEYRSLGCLPVDQFIPALMRCLDLPLPLITRLPLGHRVVARPILCGLHHEYSLQRLAA